MNNARNLTNTAARKRRWLFLLAGNEQKASSRVRGYWIAEELRELGQTCRLVVCNSPLGLVAATALLPWFDVVVFQKTYSRHHRLLQNICKWLGKRTVVDIDDGPSKSNNPVTLDNFHGMCRRADMVFAGGPELAKYVSRYSTSVELVPTGIRYRSYTPAEHRERSPVRIAWVGDARQYAADLEQILLPPLLEVGEKYSVILRLVGADSCEPLLHRLEEQSVFKVELVEDLDWSSPTAVPAQLQDADIGVYPLLNTPFNQYKCGFKALEYMACGLPVIASPNPANQAIIEHGEDGFLAGSTAQWVEALDRLAGDPKLRQKLGSSGREKVIEQYDTGVVARRILDVSNRELR